MCVLYLEITLNVSVDVFKCLFVCMCNDMQGWEAWQHAPSV